MSRPTWDDTFINICDVIRSRSTCARLKTAAILVKDHNIISIGYNGTPANQQHCDQFWRIIYNGVVSGIANVKTNKEFNCVANLTDRHGDVIRSQSFNEFIVSDLFKELHTKYAYVNEVHGEVNALLQCETNMKNSTMYTWYSPCSQCAKSIIAAKILKVCYREVYARDTSGIDLLKQNKISVMQV
jgi:deoxycytidylate deaminase